MLTHETTLTLAAASCMPSYRAHVGLNNFKSRKWPFCWQKKPSQGKKPMATPSANTLSISDHSTYVGVVHACGQLVAVNRQGSS